MNILFFHPNVMHVRAQDITYENLQHGSGFSGTETALLEIGCALARKGHRVTIAGISDRASTTNGVSIVPVPEVLQRSQFLRDVDVYCPLFYLSSPEHDAILRNLGAKARVWVWFHCFIDDTLVRNVRRTGRIVLGSFVSGYMVPHYDPRLFDATIVVGNGIGPACTRPITTTPESRRGTWVFHASFERGGRVADRVHDYVRRRLPAAAHTMHHVSYYTADHGPEKSLSKTALAGLLSECDYFVYPLVLDDGVVHHDTYACVILEALARGVVVVTWNVACIPEVYGDLVVAREPPRRRGYDPSARYGSNPWMVSDDAVAALGNAVLALEFSPADKARLRARGSDWAATQTWERRADAYHDWLSAQVAAGS